jgi:hypothetical protein
MKSILFIDGNIPPPYTSTSMYILPSNFDWQNKEINIDG